jgi:hypothetical protein
MLILTVAAGLSAAPAQGAEPEEAVFRDVVVSDRFFKPGVAWPSLAVQTRQVVGLDCLVYDTANRLLAHKVAEGPTNRFTVSLDNLPPASRGVYLFSLVASDPELGRVGIYPKSPGGGQIVQVRESELDTEKQMIRYTLPRAACVRLRAGFRDGLYLQPIISGEPQPAGVHTVPWDGTSQGGLFTNLYAHPAVQVSILAVSLPANILVAPAESTRSADAQAAPVLESLPPHLAGMEIPSWRSGLGQSAPHFLIADDYTLKLEAKEDVTSRTIEFRIDCAPADRPRLLNHRFELMLFLDGVFLAEDERSQLPFSYRMSSRGIPPGRHLLTANVIDSESAVGTSTESFNLAKP